MKRVYRLLRSAFAASPFDGEGSYRYGGRWSSPGTRLAYASEHLTLAMVEYFVHLDDTEQPSDLVLATAEIPRDVSRTQIKPVDLPENWRTSPAPAALAAFGDEFVKSGKFAALVVPSALAPEESNWLLNPAHPEFRRINFSPPGPFQYDRRFF